MGLSGHRLSRPTISIQACGTSVDRRSDIWSFGAVLYEILTGQRLFQGATISDTLAGHPVTYVQNWLTAFPGE